MPAPTTPPQAAREPHEHVAHGVVRPDPYAWLRRVDSDAVVAHLTAERAWYESATGHLTSLVGTLRAEMTGRVPRTDSSVSWRLGHWFYYTRVPAGRDYPQLLRDLNTHSSPERREPSHNSAESADSGRSAVLLDLNDLAGVSDYVEASHRIVSPDERLLAWSVDLVGDEVYRLRFRDLQTGRDLDDEVPRSYYGGAWSADSRWFFYTVHDDAYRPHQVWRHRVGTPATEDVLVLEEPDERFELLLRGTRSGGLVVIWARSRDTTEVWVVDTHAPEQPARSVGGRRPGVEYHAEHLVAGNGDECLLVVTDDGAPEYRLARAPVPREADQDHTVWEPVRPERPEERLERVDAFATHVVLSYRAEFETRLRVLAHDDLDDEGRVLRPAYDGGAVRLGPNHHYPAEAVTVADSAYLCPTTWSDVDLASGERAVRHRQEAPGHDPDRYVTERRTFPAPDGTGIPATLLRHLDTPLDGTAPAMIYAYGAYEATDDPAWDPALPSLLDRGVVWVHAHVRGGGEGGRRWWQQGRLAHKQNTFSDLVAVADGLAGDLGGPALVDGRRIATRGLSAGGLLQGAVFSQRPDRWRAVVAEVPFVDVLTTMSDPSIPLTVNEWDEWGDPRVEEQFRWMLAYSPYDNLPPAGGRPDLLVTGALHDPRVMVWEPAKWVAALRHSDPDWGARCLFRVETGAGAHAGPSGRLAHLAYEAEIHAWVLDRLDITAS